jgi:hypothetical protein
MDIVGVIFVCDEYNTVVLPEVDGCRKRPVGG